MIDLRYNLSLLAYKLKNKLNRKKDGDEEEDFNGADNYREDFTDDDDAAPDSYSDEETPEDGDIVIPDDEEEVPLP